MSAIKGYKTEGFQLHPAAVANSFTALQSLNPARFRLAALILYVVLASRLGMMKCWPIKKRQSL